MAKTDRDLIDFFNRHLVPIFIALKLDQDVQSTIITAFLMSVRGKWLLATAGHTIKKIDKLINKYGYSVDKCALIDGLGYEAKFENPIPFLYEKANPTCISDKRDFDYGFLNVSPYYREALEKNNVQPLDEEVWKKRPQKIDFYLLMGIPYETLHVNPKNLEFTPTLFSIK